MTQSRKDQAAEAVVTSAIFDLLGQETIDRVVVTPSENQAGEPDLSVVVFLKPGQERISGARFGDTIVAAGSALREIEDDRFPFVTVLAPDGESAEDTRRPRETS